MSIDASVHFFFPIARATAALEAIRKSLRKRKYLLGIQVVSPDGTTIRLPATAMMNQVSVTKRSGEHGLVDVPTISEVFPQVLDPEPLFLLEELTSISMLDVEIAFRKDGKLVEAIPAGLSIGRGQDYLSISFDSSNRGVIDQFYLPRFRSLIARIFERAGGVAAIYVAMGEWSAFADHRPIEAPEESLQEDDVDACVAYLVEALSA